MPGARMPTRAMDRMRSNWADIIIARLRDECKSRIGWADTWLCAGARIARPARRIRRLGAFQRGTRVDTLRAC